MEPSMPSDPVSLGEAPESARTPGRPPSGSSGRPPLFWPVVLLIGTVLVLAGLQTWALWAERGRLEEIYGRQQATIEQARRMRSQLDALARETAQLAAAGNSNARILVRELAKRGIRIGPGKSAAKGDDE